MIDFNINEIKTPYYIVDERLVKQNLEKLKYVIDKTDCKILLAQKAFSMYSIYPLISEYLHGATASGLLEAKLGYEKMGKENHIFSPAYLDCEFDEIVEITDHIVFNSFSQWNKFKNRIKNKSAGIRINPEISTQDHSIYDPCAEGSRFGVTLDNFDETSIEGLKGIHFHTLCEQNVDDLIKTLDVVEEKFGKYLYQMDWINFGGGHHITRSDYDVETLIDVINRIKTKYNLTVYLEPGEAVVLNTGFLVSEVLEIINNGMDIAIMDASAACHMPDILEMPYRAFIINSDMPNIKQHTYRLGGNTCLAGDIIGDYSFDEPLKVGDKLIFCDMSHYSMVKNNTFNGMKLPSIAKIDLNGNVHLIKSFGYEDFKARLS